MDDQFVRELFAERDSLQVENSRLRAELADTQAALDDYQEALGAAAEIAADMHAQVAAGMAEERQHFHEQLMAAWAQTGPWVPVMQGEVIRKDVGEGVQYVLILDGIRLKAYFENVATGFRNYFPVDLTDDSLCLCRRIDAQPDPLAKLIPPLEAWPHDAAAWFVGFDGSECWLVCSDRTFWYMVRSGRLVKLPPGIKSCQTLRLRPSIP